MTTFYTYPEPTPSWATPSLVARRIGAIRFGLYVPEGSPPHDDARSPKGWLRVPWVGWNKELADLPAARCVTDLLPLDLRRAAANGLSAQLALARALGAAVVLPKFIAHREGNLRRVAAVPFPVLAIPLWLVVNQEVRGSPAVEAVTAWIEERLAELR